MLNIAFSCVIVQPCVSASVRDSWGIVLMESQHLQHDNTFRKILYENDQASSLGARNTQEECPSSQLPTPVPSGKKSSRFYQSEGRKKVVLVVFLIFATTSVSLEPFPELRTVGTSGRGRLKWDAAGGERVCRFAFGLEMVLKTRRPPGGRR